MSSAARRPVVLVFLAHYCPAFRAGGPLRTLRNMVELLADRIDFRIVTRDRDLGDAGPFGDPPTGTWVERDGARVFYGDARHRRPPAVFRLLREVRPDVVYLNSFFDPRFSILPLLLRRVGLGGRGARWVIAPRGEFSPGALALKAGKKRAFIAASRLVGLHAGLVWQASSAFEADDIRRTMGRTARRIEIVPNLTARVEPLAARPPRDPGAPLAVCFVSRISPKKNLLFAIDAVRRSRRPVRFDIYGPVEDEAYWSECRAAIAAAPPSCRIEWKGALANEQVRAAVAEHDLFLFPTLGENFGHVIFEALSAGVPVLVSDRTPWRDLEERGSGWVRSLDDPQGFVVAIESAAARGPEEREAARRAAHAHALEVSRSEEVLGANLRLFLGDAG